jgi:hypothetical protein
MASRKTPFQRFFSTFLDFFHELNPFAAPGEAERKARKTARKFEKATSSELRRTSPDESELLTGSRKARAYVPVTTKRVTRRTPHISARQHRTKQERERHGLTPEQATEGRKQGAIRYSSAEAREQAAKAGQTREVNRRLRKSDSARAAKYGFAGRNQTRKVLDYLEAQFAKHERYLARRRGELPEAEYRETVELAFRYLGADDERLRRMQMSPDIAG